MKLIKQLCIGLCSLAIVSHAAPLLENNHLKIKDGAVELDRKGDVVFSDDFSKGLENWEVSNFENKLVMDARTVFGEKAAYIGMEKTNSDTAAPFLALAIVYFIYFSIPRFLSISAGISALSITVLKRTSRLSISFSG